MEGAKVLCVSEEEMVASFAGKRHLTSQSEIKANVHDHTPSKGRLPQTILIARSYEISSGHERGCKGYRLSHFNLPVAKRSVVVGKDHKICTNYYQENDLN
jgi:hypothetical protein